LIGPVGIAALVALFSWWFFTGASLLIVRGADQRGPNAHRIATLLALPTLLLGAFGFCMTLEGSSAAQIYLGFLSTLAIWGWIELAFLTGVIAGPNRSDAPKNIPEWERFIRAWGTIAYHEMLLLAALLVVLYFGWGSENIIGLWTFVILYFARISAKLNLFFGVPRINIEFLPKPLGHLPSHFKVAQLNWVFPISITALSFATACWLERLYTTGDLSAQIGFTLLASLSALALLEHWLMVLPLPDAKLWRWMLPARDNETPDLRPEDAHGL
jgi:putative photosynthetic complex assembly protein 2